MQEQLTQWRHRPRPKEANFFAVVLLCAVALVFICLIAYFFVGGVGASLLPRSHPRNAEPTSQISMPVTGYNV